jgi:hypothetical protein
MKMKLWRKAVSNNLGLPEVSFIQGDKDTQLAALLKTQTLFQLFWFELVDLGLMQLVGWKNYVDDGSDGIYEWAVSGLIVGTERGAISFRDVYVSKSDLQGNWLNADDSYFHETLNDIIMVLERDLENEYGAGALETYQSFLTGEVEDDEEILPYSELGARLIAEKIAGNQWKDKDPQWRPNPTESLAHWDAVPTEKFEEWLSEIAYIDRSDRSGCDVNLNPEGRVVAGWSQTQESARVEISNLLLYGFFDNFTDPESITCRYFLECILVHPATTPEMKSEIAVSVRNFFPL